MGFFLYGRPIFILSILSFFTFKTTYKDDSNFHLVIFFLPVANGIMAACVIAIFVLINKFFDKFLKKISIWAGRVTYSMYLFHIPLIFIISNTFEITSFSFSVLINFSCLILICLVCYIFFEKRILDARPNYT